MAQVSFDFVTRSGQQREKIVKFFSKKTPAKKEIAARLSPLFGVARFRLALRK
jgi:hypothetical protein